MEFETAQTKSHAQSNGPSTATKKMYGPAVPWPLLSVSHRICTAVLNDNTFIKPQKYVLILKCIKCKRTRKEEKHFCNLLFADLPYFYSKHESNIIHGNTSSALLNSSLFLYIYFAPSYFLPLKFCNVHKQTAMRKKKKWQKWNA